ncbi:50S ribosomal protein L3 [Cerasicoccus maritimus]|uniref:50S ribosomal protein L3 n=1 Tax=Cerasicoccus maritimus TaxID=490089 RepID=UPI0028526E9D|nr:50S ribosomal protein L3 [Cerasicoccus maritimus]
MSFTLIGKKIGMTQIFDGNELVPVTVVEAGPCPVVQVKSSDKDGYEAVQIGYSAQKEQRVSKQLQGHFAKAKVAPTKELREFRTGDHDGEYNVGDVLTVSKFEAGQKVDIIGTTKGKGFQGVVKRWGFGGGPASHGSMFHRRGGSYGHCQWPGEVWKGKKMPGHTGAKRRTTQNLKVVKVLEDKNLLLLKGSVHGHNGGTVYVRTAVKKKRSA